MVNNKKSSPFLVLKGALYGTFLDNAIIRADYSLNGNDSILFDGVMCRVRTNINAQSAVVYGASGKIKCHFNNFISLSSTLNYTVGKIHSSKEPFSHIPPIFGRTKLILEKKKWDLELFSEYNGWKKIAQYASGSVDNLAEATKDGTPSWFTLNIRAGIELNQLAQIQIGAYNIMDAHYKVFASGISAPGRSIMVSLRATF